MSRTGIIAFGALSIGLVSGCHEKSAVTEPDRPSVATSADASPSITARGRAVFSEKCSPCHGAEGKGDGAAADLLVPHPPDFTRGLFPSRERTGVRPTPDDLILSLNTGLHGRSMPGWRNLADSDRRAVIAYLLTLFPMSS
ncbi:MAG: cytochrome c [Planctomycetes bacterium]|nr:cytochrome c [Planctomycetota bacterium]MBI3843377.1 cytochrome c [Planctomycetota bacterium]